MELKLIVSHHARRRFREVLSFYRTYMTPREVSKRANEVLTALRYLKDNPGWGAFEELVHVSGRRHRRVVAGNFKIVYYKLGKTIRVTDIFDSRQDPKKMKS